MSPEQDAHTPLEIEAAQNWHFVVLTDPEQAGRARRAVAQRRGAICRAPAAAAAADARRPRREREAAEVLGIPFDAVMQAALIPGRLQDRYGLTPAARDPPEHEGSLGSV
jgi:hypothetical protein